MCFVFSPRNLPLLLSLVVVGMAMAAERPLELPPPLDLNLAPDVCEMPPTLSALSLQDAVHVALCKAPSVQQANSAIDEHTADLHIAYAKYLPSLHASADANRIGKHVKYSAHPAGNYDLHAYSGNARLGLSWLLFDSGRRSAQYDQAHAKLTAAFYNKVLIHRDQAITVANTYYKASSAKASAAAARDAAARAEKNYLAARRLREGGAGSIADELLAKVAWQRSLVDSETKSTAAENVKINLVTAIGLPGRTRVSLPATASTDELTDSTKRIIPTTAATVATPKTAASASISVSSALLKPADNVVAFTTSAMLPRDPDASSPARRDTTSYPFNERIIAAVHNHPRLAAARADTQAAEAETESVQAQYLPSISLQANRDMGVTPPANAIAKQSVNSWSVGLTVHIPIFDGLSTRYATKSAQARTRAAHETERTIWLEEEQRLLTDFNHMTSATQKMALLKDAESSAGHAYRSAQIRYQQGVGTAIELLKAQDELAHLQQAAIDVHYELLASQFRLAVALDALPPVHVDRY